MLSRELIDNVLLSDSEKIEGAAQLERVAAIVRRHVDNSGFSFEA